MKNRLRFFSLLACVVLFNGYIHAQPGNWTYIGPDPLYLGGIDDFFSAITFADSLTGYATDASNPRMMKTTDGGVTWQMMPVPTEAFLIQFITAQTGWISDGYTLYKTTNGGNNWVAQFDTNNLPIHSAYTYFTNIDFLDANTGFIAAPYCLEKTADGGITWQSVAPWSIDSSWQEVDFINPDTGWAFSNDSTIAKTTDGGQTWTAQRIAGLEYDHVIGSKFYSANMGIALTQAGSLYRTNDGCNSWFQLSFPLSYHSQNLKSGQGGFLYSFGEDGLSAFSYDSGSTWRSDTANIEEEFGPAYFRNPANGFYGGNAIYTTTDSGRTWNSNIPSYPLGAYPIMDIAWTSPTTALAITEDGSYESDDNGFNWNLVSYGSFPIMIRNAGPNCYFTWDGYYTTVRYQNGLPNDTIAGELLYAQSRDSFIILNNLGDSINIQTTIDGGNTWSTIFQQPTSGSSTGEGEWTYENLYMENMSYTLGMFMNWNTGVVAYLANNHSKSVQYVTVNGGASWTLMNNDPQAYIYYTKVSPSGNLYCIQGDPGYGLYRFDTTANWQFVNYGNALNGGGPGLYPSDFDWSPDGIMWTTLTNQYTDVATLGYSMDNGNTWNIYPLEVTGFSMLKNLPGGKFIGGSTESELLQYDGAMYNCRINGNVFFDFNHNGVFDGYDKQANAYPVKVMPGGLIAFTGPDGNYITAVDSGSYTIAPNTFGNFRAVPDSLPVTFANANGVSTGNNFALQPIDTTLQDLGVFAFEGCQSDPGFAHTTYIFYSNFGVVPVQPTITMVLDSTLTFDNASVTPASVSGNTITWNLPVINPFQHGMLTVNSTLSESAQIGDLAMNVINISPITGDANPLNNTDSSYFVVLGSFDPNFKTVTPTTIVANQSRAQSQLQYTVSFQNTGTDSTHFILVEDPLSPDLNPASLQVLGASLSYDYYFASGNVLVFRFNNAHLPDSATDPVGSRGFVSFVLSPYAKEINTDTVYNSASIYFDYNTPVTTQPAKLVVSGVVTDIQPVYGDISLKVFPNPASTIVYVESSKDFQCTVYDLQGRELLSGKSTGSRWVLDASKLASGMYLLQINQGGLQKGYSVVVTGR